MTNLVVKRETKRGRCYRELLTDSLPLELMLIQAGEFLMGSPEDELERSDREGPQHKIIFPEPFLMGRFSVTQEQWSEVASWKQINRELKPNPSSFPGAQNPVEKISWYDAVEFCDRLSARFENDYRLPTEAEWEYACRAGTTTPFYFGETITTELANYRGTDDETFNWKGNYGQGPKGEYREKTLPVGSFPANDWGLYDMHGNVYDWCLDHWHDSYEAKPASLKQAGNEPWLTQNEKSVRVIRGGSWIYHPDLCRSAYRGSRSPGIFNNPVGFRVVCGAPRI
ncbi:MAG: formylglycine-generating enzyme family protein [Cyanobacteria bacterium P01_H01_bin.15]